MSISPQVPEVQEVAPRDMTLPGPDSEPFVDFDRAVFATRPDRPQAPIIALSVSDDGEQSVTAHSGGPSDGNVIVWKNFSFRDRSIKTPGVRDVAISPDGQHLAWVGDGERVHVEQTSSATSVADWKVAPGSTLERVEWSPNGEGLLASSGNAAFVWLDKKLSKPLFGLEVDGDAKLEAMAWKPDGSAVVCGASTGELVLLTVAGPADIQERRFSVAPAGIGISAMRWSSDGRTLLVGRADGAVQLIKLESLPEKDDGTAGETTTPLQIDPITVAPHGNTWAASAIDISPDSSLIAIAENVPGEPRIRLIANRQNGAVLRRDVEDSLLTKDDGSHHFSIADLEFSRDGRFLWSVGEDGVIKRWRFSTLLSASDE